MHPFVYTGLQGRVLFGSGTVDKVADEIRLLSCRRALVLSTHQQSALADDLAARLGDLSVGTFTGATMHTPVDVTEAALQVVRQRRADCTVAVGGGSTTGLGKAIALRANLAQIVVPTTYAGSEATPILGETDAGVKTTRRTLKVLPQVVVYDVDLTLTLPISLSVTSGLNAIAHAVEALYSPEAARSWQKMESRRSHEHFRSFWTTPPIAMPGRTPSMALGYAAYVLVASGCRFITSSATCSAAPSIFRTPKHTPSSFPMPLRTTSPRRPASFDKWRRCSMRRPRLTRCSIWRNDWVRRPRSRN
jgi:hypothetical protein